MTWTWLNGGAAEAFVKTHKVFLIGESWLAWRNARSRGNVQKGLEDLGFKVENFADNGITLSNFWWSSNMSWQKWNQIQKHDAMVITIGFNQLSDSDMNAKDEAEVSNLLELALKRSNHVIVIVPNLPLLGYFTVRAEWYIQKQRDDLDEPCISANALKREQLYAGRFHRLLKVFKAAQHSNRGLRLVEMQHALTPSDICDDGCHLNPQGATKTASAIAESLISQTHVFPSKGSAYLMRALLAMLVFKIIRSIQQRFLLQRPKMIARPL
jgi:lysophospholipase L1-like esterase